MDESDQKTSAEAAARAGITRRSFVTTAAAAGAGIVIVPRHVLGRGMQAPSDTLNVAIVGMGGMGGSNARALMSQNIVAICDVDDAYLAKRLDAFKTSLNPPATGRGAGGSAPQKEPRSTAAQVAANQRRAPINELADLRRFMDQQLPKAQRYRDYRQMLDKQKDLDGIVVATPDHMHAIIASSAMDMGRHVYVQKPLCWSVQEARHLAQKAKTTKVVTQMGNQGHSMDEARLGYEYITSGAIGEVREVHVWTNRPLGYWPQGVPRPAPLPDTQLRWDGKGVDARLAAALGAGYTAPKDLSWDLFLGVAPPVDYHPLYHPFNWRGWVDWGQGALGDMGAHLIDHPFWSLDLGLPTVIETISTPFNGVCFPNATTTYYDFPARGAMPPVKLTWYDGGLLPPRPAEMGEEKLSPTGGVLYIGSKGKMLQDTYGINPRLLPKSLHDSTPQPASKLPRIAHQEHEMNWVEAIKGKAEISAPFDYATRLTEVMLLGIVSLRAGGKIHYDAANMKVTTPASANAFLGREYAQGWSLTM